MLLCINVYQIISCNFSLWFWAFVSCLYHTMLDASGRTEVLPSWVFGCFLTWNVSQFDDSCFNKTLKYGKTTLENKIPGQNCQNKLYFYQTSWILMMSVTIRWTEILRKFKFELNVLNYCGWNGCIWRIFLIGKCSRIERSTTNNELVT